MPLKMHKKEISDTGLETIKRQIYEAGKWTNLTYRANFLTLWLVQYVALLPLTVVTLVGLADVELNFGAFFVLHGLPLIQCHLLRTFFLHLLYFILPTQTQPSNGMLLAHLVRDPGIFSYSEQNSTWLTCFRSRQERVLHLQEQVPVLQTDRAHCQIRQHY